MLAMKKLARRLHPARAALALLVFLVACGPPGPRALLKADRLIQEGKYRQALQELEAARPYLERDPRLWNWFGLAYQGAGDAPHAVEAYQQALKLDRSSNLVHVAHYNLGCLYLEQGNALAAVNEFRSFCLLSNSLPALLKLAQAESQSKQFDAAERSFGAVLRLRPGDPTALNGLGLLNAQRNHLREAIQYFQAALRYDPQYASALLNLAILYQRQPGQQASAVQKYREYLALTPRPNNYETVRATLQRLEQEIAPPRPAPTNGVALAKTNPPAALTNLAPSLTSVGPTTTPPATATQRLAQVTLTNAPKPSTNLTAVRTSAPPVAPTQTAKVVPTNPPAATALVARVVAPPNVSTQLAQRTPPTVLPNTNLTKPPVSPGPRVAATSAPPVVTVVTLPDETPLKSAQDFASPPPRTVASPPTVGHSNPPAPSTGSVWVVTAAPPKSEKKNLFQKLNPFGKKQKPAPAPPTARVPDATKVEPEKSAPAVAASGQLSNPVQVASTTAVAPRPELPRYTYLSPAKPAPGDRPGAEPYFAQGLKAQQEKRADEALRAYRLALGKDPAFYEAYYNISLLAFQVADWKSALYVCETALAINPDAVNARLNLGLALEQANYPVDAALELEKVLHAKPDEVRAHFALANVYAQKLGQPAKARLHYQKVLELDPRHPRAEEIRYWLAANP
jgi:tetratricopeptide (TPR) repeat protein